MQLEEIQNGLQNATFCGMNYSVIERYQSMGDSLKMDCVEYNSTMELFILIKDGRALTCLTPLQAERLLNCGRVTLARDRNLFIITLNN